MLQEADENSVMLNSLFGSLKTSQQADNILLIQRKVFKFKEPYFEKYLQVKYSIYISLHNIYTRHAVDMEKSLCWRSGSWRKVTNDF